MKIDWGTIIIALIGGIPSMLLALATLITAIKNSNTTLELTKSVDGHMTTLIENTKVISEAKGKAEGKVEGILQVADLVKPTVIQDRRND